MIVDIIRGDVYILQPVEEQILVRGEVPDLNVEPSTLNELGFDIATITTIFTTMQVSVQDAAGLSNRADCVGQLD